MISPTWAYGGVLLALFLIWLALALVAGFRKWDPAKPIKWRWAVLTIGLAVLAAGVGSSAVAGDSVWVYRWFVGLAILAVVFPVLLGIANVLWRTLYSLWVRRH